jgi:hypothetical protein
LKRAITFYLLPLAILLALAYFGLQANPESFVGSLFAAALAIFIMFFVEMKRKPVINIIKEENPFVVPDGRRFLRVIVENRAPRPPLNFFLDRNPAYQVRAWITFLTEDNELVFSEGRNMIGRWSRTPEPVRPIVSVSQGTGGATSIGTIWDLSITRDAVDIAAGASELLDIVMRSPGETGCHGWHNRIIQNPNILPEDTFDLSNRRYHALVRVDVSGTSFTAVFRIVCDVGIQDFRLEPFDP